jgi:hypothetical protein
VQIRGEGPELADVAPLGVATFRDGDVVVPGADVDAGGIQVDPPELGWEPCGPLTVEDAGGISV